MKQAKKIFFKCKQTKWLFIAGAILIAAFGIWFVWFRPTYDAESLPIGPVSYKFISSRPEAKLYYPNSTVFSPFGGPQERREGISSAQAGAILISNDPPEKIYAWYRNWLLARGWNVDKNAFAGTLDTQLSLEGYSKGRRKRQAFYVAMNDTKRLGGTLGRKIPANVTVFEFRYYINPY